MAITGASLQPIYDRLHAVQGYHPMSADTFADWSVEAGDIVTMKRDNTPLATPIHNAKIVWRGSPQVTLNSTGNEERESISRVSRRKYGRGGGMTNDQRIYRDMWSEDGHLHSELEITESVLRTEYAAADSRLQSEFEITASHLRTEFTDADTALHSEIEVTASRLWTEFTDADNHLQGEIEATASHLRTEYTDADNALRGEIEVTASHLRADYEAADGRLEGELEMTASHLRTEFTDSDERLKSEFEITASHLQTEFQDADARLASEMEITASHMRTEYTDGINSVHSEVVQTASSWSAKISGVVDSEGNVTAASIAIAINASTGESEAIIDAQKVYIGNQKSTTVIAGKCSLSDVSADYIKTQIASIAEVVMLAGNVTGTLRVRNGSGQQQDVSAGIWDLDIAQSGNTYTLRRKRIMDTDWVDVGSFSRATSLSGAWSGGHLEVTASPQNEHFHQYLEDSHVKQNYDKTEYTSGPIWYVPIYWKYDPNEQTSHETGQRIEVNTTNMLQSKTVTSNGVVYPDSGYLGLESVDVQVPAPSVTPVISYAWSSTGQLTVSTTPAAQADLVRRLGQDTSGITWNGNTATIPIVARFTVDSQERSEATNFNATVDATSRYRAGSINVNLADPTWSTPAGTNITVSENTATVSTTGRVNSSGADANVSKTVPIKTSQGDWNSSNKKYVYVHYSSTANANRIARVEVDAGTIYNNGVAAGKNAVSISKTYDTANSRVVFAKSEGTASTKAVRIGVSGSWNGNIYTYYIKDYEENTSGTNIEANARTVDASARYNAGVSDGKTAVTLNNPSWSNGSPYTSGATNTVSVSTSGRPTQLSKSIPVTLVQNAWSGNSKTVDIQTTNGAVVARITVDGSSIYTAGQNSVTVTDIVLLGHDCIYSTQLNPEGWYAVFYLNAIASNGDTYYKEVPASIQGTINEAYTTGYNAGNTDGYNSGVTAGKNAVNIVKTYDNANSRVTFAKSTGSANTKAVKIGVKSSGSGLGWDGNVYKYRICDYEDNQQGTNLETNARSVDASARYTAGQNSVTVTDIVLLGHDCIYSTQLNPEGWYAVFYLNAIASNGDTYYKEVPASIQGTINEAYTTGYNAGYAAGSSASGSVSYDSTGYVEQTSQLPSGTKYSRDAIKTAIVDNRNKRGYNYIRIKVGSGYHVFYWVNNGNGWTS